MRRSARFVPTQRMAPRQVGLHAGAIAGLIGGGATIAADLLLSLVGGQSVWLPFRCIAALVYGAAAMSETGFQFAPVAAGMAIHLAVSIAFGCLFQFACHRIKQPPMRLGIALLVGLAYGISLWLIAILCVIPRLDPWLAELAPVTFLLHHLVYGGVVGLACVSIVRVKDAWPAALRGPQREQAIAELRVILVHGLQATLSSRVRGDTNMLIEDVAQDALMTILRCLDTYRGQSRFTTWAQTIATRVAFSELRRRRWRDVSLQAMHETDVDDQITGLPPSIGDPERAALRQMMADALQQALAEALTPRQRQALVALATGDDTLEDIAMRIGTNRNALYKLIHDARQRLRARLDADGITPQEILAAWSDR